MAERLMGTMLVAPVDPLADRHACLDVLGEVVLPDALLFQRTEEALDHAVLLGCVGRDELLRQPVVAAGDAEAACHEDEPAIEYDGMQEEAKLVLSMIAIGRLAPTEEAR